MPKKPQKESGIEPLSFCIVLPLLIFLRRLYGSSTGSLRFAAPPIAPKVPIGDCFRIPSGTGVPPMSPLWGDWGVPPFLCSIDMSHSHAERSIIIADRTIGYVERVR